MDEIALKLLVIVVPKLSNLIDALSRAPSNCWVTFDKVASFVATC